MTKKTIQPKQPAAKTEKKTDDTKAVDRKTTRKTAGRYNIG